MPWELQCSKFIFPLWSDITLHILIKAHTDICTHWCTTRVFITVLLQKLHLLREKKPSSSQVNKLHIWSYDLSFNTVFRIFCITLTTVFVIKLSFPLALFLNILNRHRKLCCMCPTNALLWYVIYLFKIFKYLPILHQSMASSQTITERKNVKNVKTIKSLNIKKKNLAPNQASNMESPHLIFADKTRPFGKLGD